MPSWRWAFRMRFCCIIQNMAIQCRQLLFFSHVQEPGSPLACSLLVHGVGDWGVEELRLKL
jgi:hypothetical protein